VTDAVSKKLSELAGKTVKVYFDVSGNNNQGDIFIQVFLCGIGPNCYPGETPHEACNSLVRLLLHRSSS
jgi:hypothetical protein